MSSVSTSFKIPSAHVNAVLPIVTPFLSQRQLRAMGTFCHGEEGDYFRQRFLDLRNEIANTPVTYKQRGLGNQAIVYLHYFKGGSDWYILEKDVEGGVEQAYGFAILNGDRDCAELGYISITELVECGVELDLHWTPTTLDKVKPKIGLR